MTQLHHFEITTNSLEKRVAQFQAQFGFSVFAHGEGNEVAAVAMRCHSIVVVINESGGWSPVPRGDWISDIAMKVADIVRSRERAVRAGASIANDSERHPSCRDENQTLFTIDSPFSSVRHTMIAGCSGGCTRESTSSHGLKGPSQSPLGTESNFPCLPGFVKCPLATGQLCSTCNDRFPRQPNRLPQTSHVDHVTFACEMGTLDTVVDWYKSCLGFCRFFPSDGSDGPGFITYGDSGMRMLASRYWQCRESGVRAPTTSKRSGQVPIQLVFAEPIPGTGPNQVQMFLDENGCAGVQHIAFHCEDMVSGVSCLRQNGVQFVSPPPEYYSLMEKVAEICQAGQKLELLRANGILIDTEVEEDEEEKNTGKHEGAKSTRYLMQVFSQPLFERETFFIELIRRCGAKGFGSGNIAALWKALDIHFKQNRTN